MIVDVSRSSVVHLTADADLVPGTQRGLATLWPYTQSWRRLWRSTDPRCVDPINIVVLRAEPDELMEALTGRGDWERPGDGTPHRTWVNGTFRYMVDHIARGNRAQRVHMRLFRLGPHTVAGAHYEVLASRGGHEVRSWDRAREAVVDALERVGFVELAPTAVITPPNLRDVPGDGRARRLVRG
jgi:hypothetical protein